MAARDKPAERACHLSTNTTQSAGKQAETLKARSAPSEVLTRDHVFKCLSLWGTFCLSNYHSPEGSETDAWKAGHERNAYCGGRTRNPKQLNKMGWGRVQRKRGEDLSITDFQWSGDNWPLYWLERAKGRKPERKGCNGRGRRQCQNRNEAGEMTEMWSKSRHKAEPTRLPNEFNSPRFYFWLMSRVTEDVVEGTWILEPPLSERIT